jgi:hypothetical protein
VKQNPEIYTEVSSGQVKRARLAAHRRGVVRVEDGAGPKEQASGQQPSLFDFLRTVP